MYKAKVGFCFWHGHKPLTFGQGQVVPEALVPMIDKNFLISVKEQRDPFDFGKESDDKVREDIEVHKTAAKGKRGV